MRSFDCIAIFKRPIHEITLQVPPFLHYQKDSLTSGCCAPASNSFNAWKTKINPSVFEEIKNEFGVPAGTDVETWSWRCDIRRFVEDGKQDEFHIINTAAGHIPELM